MLTLEKIMFLNDLVDAGVEFSVGVNQGCISLNADEIMAFLESPDGFRAAYSGLTVI